MRTYYYAQNHVHGIVIINKPDDRRNDGCNDEQGDGRNVETQNFASLPSTAPSTVSSFQNQFGPQSKNLASIIRGFKIGVTKNVHKINSVFAWQPRYHDHIIRNNRSFENISNYIVNNPKNWDEDKFYNKFYNKPLWIGNP